VCESLFVSVSICVCVSVSICVCVWNFVAAQIVILQLCVRDRQIVSVYTCARRIFNALQHSVTRCNTLQHTATRYNILQQSETHCNTL